MDNSIQYVVADVGSCSFHPFNEDFPFSHIKIVLKEWTRTWGLPVKFLGNVSPKLYNRKGNPDIIYLLRLIYPQMAYHSIHRTKSQFLCPVLQDLSPFASSTSQILTPTTLLNHLYSHGLNLDSSFFPPFSKYPLHFSPSIQTVTSAYHNA